jgi:hypothetical protein
LAVKPLSIIASPSALRGGRSALPFFSIAPVGPVWKNAAVSPALQILSASDADPLKRHSISDRPLLG